MSSGAKTTPFDAFLTAGDLFTDTGSLAIESSSLTPNPRRLRLAPLTAPIGISSRDYPATSVVVSGWTATVATSSK